MRILVTGGTGTLGRALARAAGRAGHTVRIGSRHARPDGTPPDREWAQMDIAGGAGLPAALADVDCVVHAASDPQRSVAVDVAGASHLLEAARGARVAHFIHVSIVGIDRIPIRYYRSKLAAEQIVAAGGVPYSILRATQFHSFVDFQLTKAARVPLLMPIPTSFRIQSVAVSDVAEHLVERIAAGPGRRLPDLGGPEEMTLGEAAAHWRASRSVRKRVVNLPVPGKIGAAFRAGAATVPDGAHGVVRWQDWLVAPRGAPL